jgi:hypothetical protein
MGIYRACQKSPAICSGDVGNLIHKSNPAEQLSRHRRTVAQLIIIKMANPEMKSPKKLSNQPPENSPPENSPPENSPPQNSPPQNSPRQLLQEPAQQPPDLSSIYAPRTEPPPEAGTSPLMWAWVLFTALLAGLVAWSWVQYLQEPKPSTSKTAPAPVEPALPTVLPTVPSQDTVPPQNTAP